MQFEAPDTPFDAYLAKLAERGGIVEERITGVELRSPSVQLRVTPTARSSCCRRTTSCSADPAGRATSAAASRPISATPERSARHGRSSGHAWPARGCWAASPSTSWSSATRQARGRTYAIELNLRKGGTTHPFLTLQFLTDGRYDADTGLFLTPTRREKHLVATDHLESPSLRGLSIDDLFDIVARHGLHFDQSRSRSASCST